MRKNRPIVLLLAGLTLMLTLYQCKSTHKKNITPQLDAYFEQQLNNLPAAGKDSIIPGLSVIITKKDTILYNGNFGFANLEQRAPITKTTIFDIASVSKQFTGMAIALLEANGDIAMNDNVVKYIPDLPAAMSDITIYQLLHHTSGIRDWPTLFALKGWQPTDTLSLDDIYEVLQHQEGLNFTPGTEFSYSNSNYNLLAKVVEAVSDTTFEAWMHDYVFVPLGMENTYYLESSNTKESPIATSYYFDGRNYHAFTNNLSAPGSSSLMSSNSDMSEWLMNFHNKTLGGEDAFSKITQKGKLTNGESIVYGHGLYISNVKNKKTYMHDGAWGGYKSATIVFPEESIGVVILSNNASLNPKIVIGDIADILFDSEADEAPKDKEQVEQKINDEFFALCAGRYQQVNDKNSYLTFYKKGEDYFLNMYDRNVKLYAKSDSVFFIKEANAEFVFHLKNGEVNSHTLEQNGKSYLALRVEEHKKASMPDYDKLSGAFYSKELDVTYDVRNINGALIIQNSLFPKDIPLEHSEGLTFKSTSGLIQSVTFLEENGVIKNLIIDNPRAKNLLFKKR